MRNFIDEIIFLEEETLSTYGSNGSHDYLIDLNQQKQEKINMCVKTRFIYIFCDIGDMSQKDVMLSSSTLKLVIWGEVYFLFQKFHKYFCKKDTKQ